MKHVYIQVYIYSCICVLIGKSMIRACLLWLALFMGNHKWNLRVISDGKKRVNLNIALGLILELDALI